MQQQHGVMDDEDNDNPAPDLAVAIDLWNAPYAVHRVKDPSSGIA
jgi:hypothetical protein